MRLCVCYSFETEIVVVVVIVVAAAVLLIVESWLYSRMAPCIFC